MENNKKEVIQVLIIAAIFILIYLGLYLTDIKTGYITDFSDSLYSLIIK